MANQQPLITEEKLLLSSWKLSGKPIRSVAFRRCGHASTARIPSVHTRFLPEWVERMWSLVYGEEYESSFSWHNKGSTISCAYLCKEGKAYRSINVFHSMLSSTIFKCEGYDVGKHPLVTKLIQGVYNRNPPLPKYQGFSDVSNVLLFIRSFGLNDNLLNHVLQNAVMLLALKSPL